MPTDHAFITPSEKTQVSSSSYVRESAGKLASVFSHKRKLRQETLADREGISSGHKQLRKTKLFSGSLIRKMLRDYFLKNKRDHQLAEDKF